ncbi:MAG: GNAT family N-acetyltransferase [Gilvibacter sp.]
MSEVIIRPIEAKDNPHVASVIRTILIEHGVPKVGTAYEDASLDKMFEYYQQERAAYFVVQDGDTIIGGAGLAQLANYQGNVCELQKMYFLEVARGRGIGTKMLDICLNKAEEFGYETCYLETMTYMKAAQKLYQKTGFSYRNGPMGDTGHFSCPVHMTLSLPR